MVNVNKILHFDNSSRFTLAVMTCRTSSSPSKKEDSTGWFRRCSEF